jgi:ZIP family zinc transporter
MFAGKRKRGAPDVKELRVWLAPRAARSSQTDTSSSLAALLSGLVEPVAGLFGVAVVSLSEPLLPWGLGFAAGAMIYIVASEIIPETHARVAGGGRATLGIMVGLGAMMFLDTTLG